MLTKFNPTDFYAAAAFLVGEGNFICSGKYRQLAIRAAQTEKAPLVWLQGVLGGHLNGPYQYNKKANPNQKEYWYWAETDGEAAGLMMTLFSFVRSISQRQADRIKSALLKWKSTPPNSRALARRKAVI